MTAPTNTAPGSAGQNGAHTKRRLACLAYVRGNEPIQYFKVRKEFPRLTDILVSEGLLEIRQNRAWEWKWLFLTPKARIAIAAATGEGK